MKILVSGASGFIGRPICRHLTQAGHRVARLSRQAFSRDDIQWNPEKEKLEFRPDEHFEAVVHLAGENIVSGRWTASRKRRIRDSRVKGTALLCRRLMELPVPPNVFLCASAVGYYPFDTGETYDETGPPGQGFLASVCQMWENASASLAKKGTRVVHLRFGVVLGAGGGALGKMLPIFKMGLGGPVGSGRQMMSWISLPDVVAVVSACLGDSRYAGPVNVVAPQPVSNREFARALGRILKRPALLPAPSLALSLIFGQMARETLLADCRVRPKILLANGYSFQCETLESALANALSK